MTPSCKCTFHGHAPLIFKILSVCAVRFVPDQVLSMGKASPSTFGSDFTTGWASRAVGGVSCDDELTPNYDDDGDDWDFADVPVDLHVAVFDKHLRDFESTREFCCLDSVAASEDVKGSSLWLCRI